MPSKRTQCASCLGPLRYVDTEANGHRSYICDDCGDEWYEETPCLSCGGDTIFHWPGCDHEPLAVARERRKEDR